eukprot:m.467532 g.467532  ORF g.467532 m.467532 type:complete len:231 (+) comp26452_c0_seq1:124-816(+)
MWVISEERFEAECKAIAEAGREQGWDWVAEKRSTFRLVPPYLCLRQQLVCATRTGVVTTQESLCDVSVPVDDEDEGGPFIPLESELEDPARLEASIHTSDDTAVFEYHVVYSQAYAVPVLYFRVTEMDGTLINKNEAVWKYLPGSGGDTLEQMQKHMAVSQADHPALQLPFFFVHPCRTSEAMAATSVDHQQTAVPPEFNYVLSYLSLVGREVGLDAVPLPHEVDTLESA